MFIGWYIFICVLFIIWAYFGVIGLMLLGVMFLVMVVYAILSNIHTTHKNKIESNKATKLKKYRDENPIYAEYDDIVEGYRRFLMQFRRDNYIAGIENVPENKVEEIIKEVNSRKSLIEDFKIKIIHAPDEESVYRKYFSSIEDFEIKVNKDLEVVLRQKNKYEQIKIDRSARLKMRVIAEEKRLSELSNEVAEKRVDIDLKSQPYDYLVRYDASSQQWVAKSNVWEMHNGENYSYIKVKSSSENLAVVQLFEYIEKMRSIGKIRRIDPSTDPESS